MAVKSHPFIQYSKLQEQIIAASPLKLLLSLINLKLSLSIASQQFVSYMFLIFSLHYQKSEEF